MEKIRTEQAAQSIEWKGLFIVVICPMCGNTINSPLTGKETWEWFHWRVRKFVTCCNTKLKVGPALEKRTE